MVKEHLYFIDYLATVKEENVIETASDIISATTPEDAINRLKILISPDEIIHIDYIGINKDDDVFDL